ncbi:MAG: putative zinc-binding protein [Bacteroidota bacterium]
MDSTTSKTSLKPLVYSCSGCSSAAQMANHIALRLDRNGAAEMSCIAGVGGNVKKLVRLAQSGRPIIVIDGCPLACAKACLKNHHLLPDAHIVLTDHGVDKKQHQDFDPHQAQVILQQIEQQILEQPVGSTKNGQATEKSELISPQ